jgi:decaprenyl-phosphate phosphoribosyltransferase
VTNLRIEPRTAIRAAIHTRPAPLLRAMRPQQWTKNLLVASAPLAAGRLADVDVAAATVAAIACFCAASSAVYLFNDVCDLEADRLHPRKRQRPIAAGHVSPDAALVASAALAVASVAAAFTVHLGFGAVVLGYLILQAAYALGLKHESVFDIAIVSSGFLLRAVGGGFATGIPVSHWFLTVAGFGSLFAVAGKRYSELIAVGRDVGTRRSLDGYTDTYLRFVWTTAAAVTIGGYCLWAFALPDDGTVKWESISIVPFVLGMMRYAVDVDAGRAGEPEEIVARDRPLQAIGLVWLVCVVLGVSNVV